MNRKLQILRYRDLEALGYGSRQTIWRKIRVGDFPPPINLGNGQKGWLPQNIEEWRDSRPIIEADNGQSPATESIPFRTNPKGPGDA